MVDIESASATGSSEPARVLPEQRDQIPEGDEIGTVTADGADATRRCHTAITRRQAAAIIPIRKHGRPWKADCPAAVARSPIRQTRQNFASAVAIAAIILWWT